MTFYEEMMLYREGRRPHPLYLALGKNVSLKYVITDDQLNELVDEITELRKEKK